MLVSTKTAVWSNNHTGPLITLEVSTIIYLSYSVVHFRSLSLLQTIQVKSNCHCYCLLLRSILIIVLIAARGIAQLVCNRWQLRVVALTRFLFLDAWSAESWRAFISRWNLPSNSLPWLLSRSSLTFTFRSWNLRMPSTLQPSLVLLLFCLVYRVTLAMETLDMHGSAIGGRFLRRLLWLPHLHVVEEE